MIVRLLSKLFNIRISEWPRVLLICLILFLVATGSMWGYTIIEAAFLQYAGINYLPWVFVVNAILSIIAMAIYAPFTDRVANDKLLIAILGIIVVGVSISLGMLGWEVVLGQDRVLIAYPLLYLIYYVVLADIFNLHWATYVNGFYDTQTAKRIVPVVASASRMAGIVAGLTMPLLNDLLSSNRNIIIVWLGTLVAAALIVWLMPRILKKGKTASQQPEYIALNTVAGTGMPRPSYIDNLREGYRYVFQSSFLRWMALSTLLLSVLMAFLYYQASAILVAKYETTDRISNFTGPLIGTANLVMFPILLFLLSRIIGRIGLGNANLIFPTATLAICGGLIFFSPGIPAVQPVITTAALFTAGLAYLDRATFRTTIHLTIDGLLYNAVPLRMKGRARAFIGGFIVPVGLGMGGGLLLLLRLIPVAQLLSALIGVLAVALVASALVIRKQYTQALIEMLEQEDFSFLLFQEASDLTIADPTALTQLQKKLEESTSHGFTIFMAKLIAQVGGSRAIPILEPAVRAAADARTRSAMIDVLVAADLRGDAVRQLYADFLADPDGRVRQSAIVGLEQLAGPTDEQFLSRMLEMVQDPDIDVCVRALLALVRSSGFYQLLPAVQALDQLLADEEPHRRAYGVRVLGKVGDERAIRCLVKYLTDPTDEVRLEAAVAVETLSRNTMPSRVHTLVVEKMSRLLQDPIERVRQAALIVLGRIGTRESHQVLVDALTDSSPQVRATAADALVQAGKGIIPIVHPKLDSPDPQLRKMATLILSRVNPREFGALIVESSITGNLLSIYRNYGLVEALAPYTGYRSIVVLQGTFREQNQQLLDEIFYLLTAIHDSSAVKIISESLRSESPRARANATEALESLTTPQIARLIGPLFEPELPPARWLSLSKDAWDMEHPDAAQAIRQLVTDPDDPWLRTITTLALGEIGAALSPKIGQSIASSAGRQKGRKAHRPRPADLLGRLTDASEDTSSQSGDRVETPDLPTPSTQRLLTLQEIESMLKVSLVDPVADVCSAAHAANRMIVGLRVNYEEETVLSTVERVIFLKGVPFFEGMTIDQLKVLANICEEEFFAEDTQIFDQGDPGGALYVVVSGRVAIEREGRRKGSVVRLATIEAHSYFGEMSLFDGSPRSAAAVAIQDTLTLRLRREPLVALARQHPTLSLELIHVLSQRLREANDRIAELTRTRPRELHKLFDQFD